MKIEVLAQAINTFSSSLLSKMTRETITRLNLAKVSAVAKTSWLNHRKNLLFLAGTTSRKWHFDILRCFLLQSGHRLFFLTKTKEQQQQQQQHHQQQ